ncbi:sodium/potassium/calcium exchanger 2-like [Watersipora subatra]|uniref:sodium/potassium/calcium exchanger 2-like n=1 Tax=Watersipora subatra TaxID=2589382 RepID=UPI00355B2BF7
MENSGSSKSWWKVHKLRRVTKQRGKAYYTIALALAFVTGTIIFILQAAMEISSSDDSLHISKRSIDSADSNTSSSTIDPDSATIPNIGNYPKEVFTLKQLRQGAVILHTGGMIYMFIAQAIVCDEFFVPALEVIIERLHLTEDVAGATFMAAGGSAPEFFTSIAGLFLSENSVGISTIIGSAVFNILFVIGACALAAKQLLHLTWWPLFRDTCFYSLSLIVLIVSYLNWRIHYYEAIALLLCYAAYVTFMYFNKTIEEKVKTIICKQPANATNIDLVPVSSDVNLMFTKNSKEGMSVSLQYQTRAKGRPGSSLKFRAGLLQLMIQTIDPLAEGNIEDRAMKLRTLAMRNPSSKPGTPNNAEWNDNSNVSEKRQKNGSSRVHSAMGSTGSSHSAMTAVESVEDSSAARENSNQTPTKDTRVDAVTSNGGCDVIVRTVTAVETQRPQSDESGIEDDDDKENTPLDISWPKSPWKRISYILLAPIIFPLWLTLPDTRRPEKKKWFPITFLGSIIWIAFFSIMLVWWASVICATIGMSVDIIGLTVLAAGTSVPDLLTSVIVARKGFGDMAISSSIGSNIFDITVGLPLPWLIRSLMNIPKPYVIVDAEGLLCSIILLFAMLMVVIGTIAGFRWRLSKPLGGLYMFLYIAFLTISILLSMGYIPCIDVSMGR